MTTFLRDFLHKDRDQAEELDIVIINKYVVRRVTLEYTSFALKEDARDRNGSVVETVLHQSAILRRKCDEHH